MFCVNCGKKLKDDSKFCPWCGTPVAAVHGSEGTTEKAESSQKAETPKKPETPKKAAAPQKTAAAQKTGSPGAGRHSLLLAAVGLVFVLMLGSFIGKMFGGKNTETETGAPAGSVSSGLQGQSGEGAAPAADPSAEGAAPVTGPSAEDIAPVTGASAEDSAPVADPSAAGLQNGTGPSAAMEETAAVDGFDHWEVMAANSDNDTEIENIWSYKLRSKFFSAQPFRRGPSFTENTVWLEWVRSGEDYTHSLRYALADTQGNILLEIPQPENTRLILNAPSYVEDGRFFFETGRVYDEPRTDQDLSEVPSHYICSAEGEILRCFRDDVITNYAILGYADGYFVVSMWKTRSNEMDSGEHYLLFLDRDGNALYDPFFIGKSTNYINIIYLGENIFCVDEFGFINAGNGTTQRVSNSSGWDLTDFVLGPFYEGKTLVDIGIDGEFHDKEDPAFYVLSVDDLQEDKTFFMPYETLEIPFRPDGGSDQPYLFSAGTGFVYSEGLILSSAGYIFDLEGNQHDWVRRYIKGENFRLSFSGYDGGYALILSAGQGFEQTVTIIDRQGKEMYSPVQIGESDRVLDFQAGYVLLEKWDNPTTDDPSMYFIYPDGSLHTVGKDDLSGLPDLTFSYVGCGLYDFKYNIDNQNALYRMDGGEALTIFKETDDTVVFDYDAEPEQMYAGEYLGGTQASAGSEAEFHDYTGRFPALESNVVFEEDGVTVKLKEINDVELVFEVDNQSADKMVNFSVVSLAVNGITCRDSDGFSSDFTEPGETSEMTVDSYALDSYESVLQSLSQELAGIQPATLGIYYKIQLSRREEPQTGMTVLKVPGASEEVIAPLYGEPIGGMENFLGCEWRTVPCREGIALLAMNTTDDVVELSAYVVVNENIDVYVDDLLTEARIPPQNGAYLFVRDSAKELRDEYYTELPETGPLTLSVIVGNRQTVGTADFAQDDGDEWKVLDTAVIRDN